ncbi:MULTISPECIES: hypothetical protein [Myroides]|uniref:Uncharacterized protein n=1 Tax=Myroides albus TaxID=2562892 RepID=A0A6I3LDW6_9FLAO|nr:MULTISPECIES: hypothetical protein [Myroides]MTG97649.1 hypothetical protein [Myroides albus]MVX36990.1 hypothetical protein [Myroides sp. LoEW2-1]UVD79278.1 hypothetical protein NWE55_14260 [Myroides albus]
MIEKLLALQDRIYKYYNKDYPYSLIYSPRISFSKIGELFELNYFGDGYDEDTDVSSEVFEQEEGYNFGFCAVLDLIIANPDAFVSLNFNGPDAGANGFRNWDFSRLAKADITLNNVRSFKVNLTDMGDHNLCLIGECDLEDGMIAKLVSKMPKLKILQVPSAPDATFFEVPNLRLEQLIVHSGYHHQNFIYNLAKSQNMKYLKMLDFTDIFDYYSDRSENEFTSLLDYVALFKSELFQSNSNFLFKLRDNRITATNCKMLLSIAQVQLYHVIEIPGQYK